MKNKFLSMPTGFVMICLRCLNGVLLGSLNIMCPARFEMNCLTYSNSAVSGSSHIDIATIVAKKDHIFQGVALHF